MERDGKRRKEIMQTHKRIEGKSVYSEKIGSLPNVGDHNCAKVD